jgi:hypothetical protein
MRWLSASYSRAVRHARRATRFALTSSFSFVLAFGALFMSGRQIDGVAAIRARQKRHESGGGRTFSAVANERGDFDFTGLPLGVYELVATPPDGYAANTRTVKIHDPRGCGTTPLHIQYDGRVTGRVVDSRGTAIPALALELVRQADVDTPGDGRRQFFVRTADDGSFEIPRVSPDTYLLGFNSIGLPNGQLQMRRAFYPGAIERGDARAVVVGVGERVRLDDFVIPDAIKLVTVNVIIVDEAGTPVRDARLEMRDLTGRAYAGGHPISTGDDGRFAFALLENGKYEVHATKYVGAIGNQRVQLGMAAFTATAGSPTTTVVVKQYELSLPLMSPSIVLAHVLVLILAHNIQSPQPPSSLGWSIGILKEARLGDNGDSYGPGIHLLLGAQAQLEDQHRDGESSRPGGRHVGTGRARPPVDHAGGPRDSDFDQANTQIGESVAVRSGEG